MEQILSQLIEHYGALGLTVAALIILSIYVFRDLRDRKHECNKELSALREKNEALKEEVIELRAKVSNLELRLELLNTKI